MTSPEPDPPEERKGGFFRALGLGIITGAADDDPAAIGTYASAGARFGPAFLWAAPAMFPMMFAVVYLSARLGQVSGRGLFAVLRDHYAKWIVYPALIGALIGNTIEAAADLGGMAAALNLFVPLPIPVLVVVTGVTILVVQIWGSYRLIRRIFRWLTLALLTYVGAAILAKPDIGDVLRGTFVPRVEYSVEFLSMFVAVMGTSVSAYLFTWQSNQEVEEEVEMGRRELWQRIGATDDELRQTRRDVLIGMFFSNVTMYFVMLAMSSTLFLAGHRDIRTAADAAEALRPLAGDGAQLLFTIGLVGVGFLAVPVMTTGAAYNLAQTLGWTQSLHALPHEAPKFYLAIAAFTFMAIALNFIGFNPMKALVWSSVVQGFSTPPLLFLVMLMTNNPAVMGKRVNGLALNVLGWGTWFVISLASIALVVLWFSGLA